VVHPPAAAIGNGTYHDEARSARRRVAGSALPPLASPARPLAASAGSPLFCYHRLQGPLVQQQLGHGVLQLSVLLLQLAQPPRLTQFHSRRTWLSIDTDFPVRCRAAGTAPP